ncbi:uncharacterized protein LOC143468278 isoform X2 [Clavelina lepadiformis]|uniref:uncharacterized protein LOC143468278 isoform X2 n=1 Tax=Clavelina lepadiformis TaxID=159417 RepID=UPI004042D1F2
MSVAKNYFEDILSGDIAIQQKCLDQLVEDINNKKERTIYNFLGDSGSEDFLWSLVTLLSSEDLRIASNASYVIGSLAETELGSHRVLSIIRGKKSLAIIKDLTRMLTEEDSECVMNAAGTLGTLAETNEGRSWMLRQACINDTVSSITNLLSYENTWTASNAALVLARLTISEEGCLTVLNHDNSSHILTKLVFSLGNDAAGRGMNAAFAVGRLLDMSPGKERLLNCPETEKMVATLCRMLTKGDTGSAKNACFAVSCLAADTDGNYRILNNSAFNDVTNRLLMLLANDEDIEAAWFAAMTLRTISSHRRGVLRLRENSEVTEALKKCYQKPNNTKELNDEIKKTITQLKRFDAPQPPSVKVSNQNSVIVTWEKVETNKDLNITYKLFDGSKVVYKGKDTKTELQNLSPNTNYCLKLRLSTVGEESPFSEIVEVCTEEGYPSAPCNLRVIGTTHSQIRFSWNLPEHPNGTLRGYSILVGDKVVDTTYDLSYILGRLQPATNYIIHVCANTSKGPGDKATLNIRTEELGAHAPERPSVTVIGRNEVHITWNPPSMPLGRFFRYELLANKEVIYSGTDKSFYATNLIPDRDYSFTVCAITSEGKCESEPTKKRTPKDKTQNEPGRHALKTHSFKAKEFQTEKFPEKPKPQHTNVQPKRKQKKRNLIRPSSSVSSTSEHSLKYHHNKNHDSSWAQDHQMFITYTESTGSDTRKSSNMAVLTAAPVRTVTENQTAAPIKIDIQPVGRSAGNKSMFLSKAKSEYPLKTKPTGYQNKVSIEPISWNEMFSLNSETQPHQILRKQLFPKPKNKPNSKPEALENEKSFISLITGKVVPRSSLLKLPTAAHNSDTIQPATKPDVKQRRERQLLIRKRAPRKPPSPNSSDSSHENDTDHESSEARVLLGALDVMHKLQPLAQIELISSHQANNKPTYDYTMNFDALKSPTARLKTPSKGYWSDHDTYTTQSSKSKKKSQGLAPLNYRTFKGAHRPIKTFRQESPIVAETWLSNLPAGAEKNKYKFIPTQLRTQPLHLPKSGQQNRLESLTQLDLRHNSSRHIMSSNHAASAYHRRVNENQVSLFQNAPKATQAYILNDGSKLSPASSPPRNASPFKSNLFQEDKRHSPHRTILSHGDAE